MNENRGTVWETEYWWGTEFMRMGGYDFPGQTTVSDGSEGNGSMGTVFIVLIILRQQDLCEWVGQKRVRT